MTAPPVNASLAGCRRKRRFTTEEEARAVGSADCELFGDKAVGVYRCPHCGGWHTTTTRLMGKRIVTAERV